MDSIESAGAIDAAEVVLPCAELRDTLQFFSERLGFRVEMIAPADDPRAVVISGHGLRLRLERGLAGSPGLLRLRCRDPRALGAGARELTAPNGTRVLLVDAQPEVELPPPRPAFVVTRAGTGARWGEGRAGMRYRDLLPERQGGRFIASHIRIEAGGPVPDYVHYHHVRFQMIFCRKGWVRVVYEDQGPPFELHAGDCVLQPPRIRHRVLASSPGLEVIELASPAQHDTFADHALALPTSQVRPERDFGGQRFVRHQAATATWQPSRAGFEARDLGIAAATGGLASVQVVRACGGAPPPRERHERELAFFFVLNGAAVLDAAGHGAERLDVDDAAAVPPDLDFTLTRAADAAELEYLEVRVGTAAS